MRSKSYIAILFALAIAIVMMFCSRDRKRYFTNEGVVWTTDYHITYEANRDLGDSIQLIFNKLDMSVSPYNKASLISAINGNTSSLVDAYLKRLIDASRIVNRESDGAFDPTVMPLVNAWGFGYKNGTLPSRAQLDSILQFIGMDKIVLHGDTIVKSDPRVMLDFSSIAKGMACDEIGRMLARNGAVNWLVEIGGEVMASGHNSRGTSWHVSVDMPISYTGTVLLYEKSDFSYKRTVPVYEIGISTETSHEVPRLLTPLAITSPPISTSQLTAPLRTSMRPISSQAIPLAMDEKSSITRGSFLTMVSPWRAILSIPMNCRMLSS